MAEKINVDALLEIFSMMLAEHWAYRMGAAEKGCVDCSGAFVYAYRQQGKSIYHGSNRIARTEVEQLLPIGEAKPGMAAFKLRSPGGKNYDLPGQYKAGGTYYNGDLNDYYHIGLVGTDGKVWNAQSSATGFVSSPISTWAYVAHLKQVDYSAEETEESPLVQEGYAEVVAENGKTVNLRSNAHLKADILERVPVGTIVRVIEPESAEWSKICTNKYTGYMKNKFLRARDDIVDREFSAKELSEMVGNWSAVSNDESITDVLTRISNVLDDLSEVVLHHNEAIIGNGAGQYRDTRSIEARLAALEDMEENRNA